MALARTKAQRAGGDPRRRALAGSPRGTALATLRDFIDWSPFFHTWRLKGICPRILDHETQGQQARQIFAEANALLDTIIAKKQITARGVYGLFPASAVGDDIELYNDAERGAVLDRFHFLRQQANKEGSEPCRSLADFIAPKDTGLADHIGAFAVTSGIGLKELCDRWRSETTNITPSGRKRWPTARHSLRALPARCDSRGKKECDLFRRVRGGNLAAQQKREGRA
jgi:cobalamin-dependent methionine synthase I